MIVDRVNAVFAQRSWFGENDNERCDRGNQEAFDKAVARVQKEHNRTWNGIIVRCFNEAEANKLREYIAEKYKRLTIPVFFTWLDFNGST